MGLLVVFLGALLAFALSTVSGGGAGLLLLPVLARVLPTSVVPAALTVGTATSTISKLALFRRHIHWRITRRFVPGAVPGVLLGAFLLKYLNPLYLEVVIGLFLLSNLTMLLRPATLPAASTQPGSWWKLGAMGFLAGFLSGLTGAVGLLFNKFYFRYGLSRDQVIATRAANEVLLHLIKLVLYFSLGLLTGPAWQAGGVVAIGALLATAATKRFVHYLPESGFRRLGYGAMVVSGGFMLLSAARELRATENLRASTTLIGHDLEITGWWRSTSLTLELEIDESPAIEQPVSFAGLPAAVQTKIRAIQGGRSIVKIEEVWQLRHHYYELYLQENGQIFSLDVPE